MAKIDATGEGRESPARQENSNGGEGVEAGYAPGRSGIQVDLNPLTDPATRA